MQNFKRGRVLIMVHIKVVWKDTQIYGSSEYLYRRHAIKGLWRGWITDLEGDDNVYRTRLSAMNAIDKALGGTGRMGTPENRIKEGIQIIGKKSDLQDELA